MNFLKFKLFFLFFLSCTLLCAQSELEKRLKEPPKEYDFAQITLQEFNSGKEESINFLGISTHEINYFLPLSYAYKGKYPKYKRNEAKFQISVKKPIFENLLGFDEGYYFAYTQTAWWQLYATSAPFRELNYAPEFFINLPLKFNGFSALKTTRIGILHQSNGKGNENYESRSWNRLYMSFFFATKRFIFSPRFWYVIDESSLEDNKDIAKFMGYFDMNFGYLGKNTFASVLVRNNLNFKENKGAIELNAGFDPFDNGVFWYVQYFNGYGESLIDYQRLIHKLSIGFLIAY